MLNFANKTEGHLGQNDDAGGAFTVVAKTPDESLVDSFVPLTPEWSKGGLLEDFLTIREGAAPQSDSAPRRFAGLGLLDRLLHAPFGDISTGLHGVHWPRDHYAHLWSQRRAGRCVWSC